MRCAVALVVLLTGCAETRGVRVTYADGDPAELARVEVQIARAPPGGCDEVVWTAPLPDWLGEVVTLGVDPTGATTRMGDTRFGSGERLIALARGFDGACAAVAAACEVRAADEIATLALELRSFAPLVGACTGVCEPGGRCAPLRCDAAGGGCLDANADGGDGCSAACEVEPGWRCEGAACSPFASCAEYVSAGHARTGLYPSVELGTVYCVNGSLGDGWTMVARGLGGLSYLGWSTSAAIGASEPWAGNPFEGFGAPDFRLSDDAIARVQGPAPQVLLVGVNGFDFVPRLTPVGCRYAHTAPARGACAVLVDDPRDPGGPPPAAPLEDTLGAGDADMTANDPARAWRVPAVGAAEACDGFDSDCHLEIYVR